MAQFPYYQLYLLLATESLSKVSRWGAAQKAIHRITADDGELQRGQEFSRWRKTINLMATSLQWSTVGAALANAVHELSPSLVKILHSARYLVSYSSWCQMPSRKQEPTIAKTFLQWVKASREWTVRRSLWAGCYWIQVWLCVEPDRRSEWSRHFKAPASLLQARERTTPPYQFLIWASSRLMCFPIGLDRMISHKWFR